MLSTPADPSVSRDFRSALYTVLCTVHNEVCCAHEYAQYIPWCTVHIAHHGVLCTVQCTIVCYCALLCRRRLQCVRTNETLLNYWNKLFHHEYNIVVIMLVLVLFPATFQSQGSAYSVRKTVLPSRRSEQEISKSDFYQTIFLPKSDQKRTQPRYFWGQNQTYSQNLIWH